MDIVGSLIVSAAAFSLFFARKDARESLPDENQDSNGGTGGGQAGLIISYALKATFSLSYAIRASTALENMLTSCERVG